MRHHCKTGAVMLELAMSLQQELLEVWVGPKEVLDHMPAIPVAQLFTATVAVVVDSVVVVVAVNGPAQLLHRRELQTMWQVRAVAAGLDITIPQTFLVDQPQLAAVALM
jgi:hypothetical protein